VKCGVKRAKGRWRCCLSYKVYKLRDVSALSESEQTNELLEEQRKQTKVRNGTKIPIVPSLTGGGRGLSGRKQNATGHGAQRTNINQSK
jgi:hypothetical protein